MQITQGWSNDPIRGLRKVELSFSEKDAFSGSDLWQLEYASLRMPATLLQAYEPAPKALAYSDPPALPGLAMARSSALGEIQRQFFQLGQDDWVVLDSFEGRGPGSRAEVVWRVDGLLEAQSGDRSAAVWSAKGPGRLAASFIGSASATPCDSRMALSVSKTGSKPVTCLAIASARPSAALLTTWSASAPPTNKPAAAAHLNYAAADDWEITGLGDGGRASLARKGNRLTATPGGGAPLQVDLKTVPDVSAERLQMRQAFERLGAQYPRYHSIEGYRLRVTYACLLLLAGQTLALHFAYRRRPALGKALDALGALAWIAPGVYLHAVYFAV